jgi:hypothetical protein
MRPDYDLCKQRAVILPCGPALDSQTLYGLVESLVNHIIWLDIAVRILNAGDFAI